MSQPQEQYTGDPRDRYPDQFTNPPQEPEQKQRGFLRRNCVWIVPVGCGGCLVVVVAFVAVVVLCAIDVMTSVGGYKEGLARAKASPAVQSALGTPIEAGFFVSGSVKVDAVSGHADLSIPLSGPKGKGTLRVKATSSGKTWTFQTLAVDVAATGQTIDLLAEPAAPPVNEPPRNEPAKNEPAKTEPVKQP